MKVVPFFGNHELVSLEMKLEMKTVRRYLLGLKIPDNPLLPLGSEICFSCDLEEKKLDGNDVVVSKVINVIYDTRFPGYIFVHLRYLSAKINKGLPMESEKRFKELLESVGSLNFKEEEIGIL